MATIHIGVLGAGIMGLSSAIRIMQRYKAELASPSSQPSPTFKVTIYADKFPPATLSDKSACLWGPYRAEPVDKILKWAQTSHVELDRLQEAGWPLATGRVTSVSFEDPSHSKLDPFFKHIVRHYRVEESGLRGSKQAISYDAPIIQGKPYMAKLVDLAKSLGVEFVRYEADSIEALISYATPRLTALINCSGLSSFSLCSDTSSYPLRGVLVYLKPQPQLMNRAIDIDDSHGAESTYVISRPDVCVLGGTANKDNWSKIPTQAEIDGIIARCERLVPELGDVKARDQVEYAWVGLRPGRTEVRLELDSTHYSVSVIHNYGHGGSGWTLHWGCADDVWGLLKPLLLQRAKL